MMSSVVEFVVITRHLIPTPVANVQGDPGLVAVQTSPKAGMNPSVTFPYVFIAIAMFNPTGSLKLTCFMIKGVSKSDR